LGTLYSIEGIAVLLALVYLVLAAYQSIWCWLAAAISSALYIKICFDAQLYIETGLQVFYLLMAIVGYYQWSNKTVPQQTEQSFTRISKIEWILGILICTISSLIMAYYFQNNTNAKLPWLDAPVTIFSIWATWLVIKKVTENWLLWIVIDSVAVYIYVQRQLNITAILYVLYTMLAVIGYFKWRKIQKISLK
jgi:nicotinamide mononucleotide transporter